MLRRSDECRNRPADVKEKLPKAPGACLYGARRHAGSGATEEV